MTGFGPLLGKELREQWRTRRLLVVGVVFVAFGITSPLLARYTQELVRALAGDQFQLTLPDPTQADAVSQFLKNIGQTGALAAVLLAMGSVATEKERGIAALILSKPASRSAYLAAKLVAIATTLGIGVILAAIGAFVYTAILFETPSISGWLGMTVLVLLSLVVYAAITFLGSALFNSAVAAGAFGLAGIVLTAVVGAIPSVASVTPGALNTVAGEVALGRAAADVPSAVVANVVLVSVASVGAWLAFRRQEL
ncbi:MAG: ABC transporter permease subunit [Chloroflexota bacterium]